MKGFFKLLAGVLFLAIPGSSTGQNIMLYKDVNKDTVISNFGPNMKHYVASYIGYAVVVGELDDQSTSGVSSLREGRSFQLDGGVYYKRKFSSLYSAVADFGYRLNVYSFDTDYLKFPQSQYDPVYSRLVISNVHAAVLNRINFGSRGNIVGKYVAIGGSADYGYVNKWKEKYNVENFSNHKWARMVNSNLNYVNRIAFNGEVQLGLGQFVLTGTYRLSDLLKGKAGFQVPPASIGLRLDMGAL